MMNRGSEWHRWEPHIHAPGTVMNDQFSGPNAWEDYLSALKAATPVIKVIAVTDYYVTDTYEEIRRHRAAGRLPDVELVFPNIEVRLDAATASGRFVNMHLFVSPEDDDHIEQLHRLLRRLEFRAFGDRFDCTRDDLIRLGREAAPNIVDDRAALRHGATQFKVNLDKIRKILTESDWAKKNIIVAVAGSATDGTSGVREAADQTIRQEIEKFAHVIFASSSAQREFWLGQRSLTVEEIRSRYGGLKPCLHGSDAHQHDVVANPFGDRFSWIKGGLEFDALRQACIEPRGRAFVGSEAPQSATPSQVIASVKVIGASWAKTPEIQLNPGLVAIIGGRGSGKTALADMIAAGCDAIGEGGWDESSKTSPSFLVRARNLIGQASVELTWGAGDICTRQLDGSDSNSPTSYPRARYLSQQFVEELCSSSGLSDGLLEEIERVIFESHHLNDRDGAINFEELLDQRASRFRQARNRDAEAVAQLSEEISLELEKEKLVGHYDGQVKQKAKLIEDYKKDRARLVPKGSEERAKRHGEITAVVEELRDKVRQNNSRVQALQNLTDEVKDQRSNRSPEVLRQTRAAYSASGMNDQEWEKFLLDYTGDVDAALAEYLTLVKDATTKLKGKKPDEQDETTPYFADDAELGSLPLALLEAEMTRLEKLIGADRQAQRQYAALTQKLGAESAALEALKGKLKDAQGAKDRRQDLQKDRKTAYRRVFDALIGEQTVLENLYSPLVNRLATAPGSLQKLGFSVSRDADADQWAEEAEELLVDRRRQGPFRGRGTLAEKANAELKKTWESGSAKEISEAMDNFIDRYSKDLLAQSPVPQTEQAKFREWSRGFAHWLFSTDHIQLRYEIKYDGVEIRKLSPGTRGIVLLLLYLALDDADDRPLIIDQPEENLDPKSVFDELVQLFVETKSKRQVIMVTHNANLVINTDADQVIIAEAGPHPPGALPPITYTAGGLENAEIRKSVCDILEGGEAAFQERARRLRVHLDR